jgi:tungstate transport system ATP-binding protein
MAETGNGMFPLVMRNVGFAAGDREILRDVNLTLEAGRRTIILGPNGAGKSVTLRLLHGLLRPTRGEITWGGKPAQPAAQAMVFQRPVLLRRSALANIEYALDLAGVPRAERTHRAIAALARVGLPHVAARAARVLSGGEQQRVALARAWALAPRILFLDEPTASLDPAASREVERIVADIAAGGTRIVMITHHLGQARRLADDIVFMHDGRITEHTPADVFFRQAQSREADDFLKGELP